jgi:signal transduction histidine kinase
MDRLERLIDHDGRAAHTVLHHVRETVRENLLELRRSIWGLRPSPLEQQGLVDALRREVDALKAKGLAGATEVRMEVRGEQRRLSGLVEDEVFRVAQEGLTNALKHAGAAEVVLALQFQADRLRVTIRDNGRGFVLADAVRRGQSRSTFGLVGMSERADRLGAQFDLQSRPGGGTRLTLEVPLLGE